jgi:hypothetical protein
MEEKYHGALHLAFVLFGLSTNIIGALHLIHFQSK